ncbi:MAG: glycosyltransferase family 2 protein [Candidatus Gastranaerophilales bacterium]|nr:glycosyltransferase family 2 protein [Candidatus Gastranaerophilales bacterium]
MKDRCLLILMLATLWSFLVGFNYYVPQQPAFILLMGFVAGYTILINIAYKHQRRKLKKKPIQEDTSYKPFVSIMVPCHCEELVISETIENILALDYENFELILIDDRSTDNTAAVLTQYEENYPRKIKAMIRPMSAFPGKSAVLNEAFELSKGEVICVFDADARIKPDFLNRILPKLAPKDVGAVQARKVVSNRDFNFLTRCQDNEMALDSHFQCGRDSIKGAVELRGNGQLIKREALLSVGGWNNHTITDDLDLSTKLHLNRWDVRFCLGVEVYEEGVLTFGALIKQRRRWIEGSVRRYLDYFGKMLTSKTISLFARLDMLAYIAEFLLPIWLVSECIMQTVKCIEGQQNNMMSSFALAIGLGFFFFAGLLYSLRRYKNLSYWQTFKQSVETAIYVVVFWSPLVIFIIPKIIFTTRSMDWGKTDHGTLVTAEEKETQPQEV